METRLLGTNLFHLLDFLPKRIFFPSKGLCQGEFHIFWLISSAEYFHFFFFDNIEVFSFVFAIRFNPGHRRAKIHRCDWVILCGNFQ